MVGGDQNTILRCQKLGCQWIAGHRRKLLLMPHLGQSGSMRMAVAEHSNAFHQLQARTLMRDTAVFHIGHAEDMPGVRSPTLVFLWGELWFQSRGDRHYFSST